VYGDEYYTSHTCIYVASTTFGASSRTMQSVGCNINADATFKKVSLLKHFTSLLPCASL
jgi:hypothetical protein